MRIRLLCLLVIILLLSQSGYTATGEVKSAETFNQAAIATAIELMPQDMKQELLAVKKDLTGAPKPKTAPTAGATGAYYFVDKQSGTGPGDLTEKFRIARKGVTSGSTYKKLGPSLGELALCVADLCQPYHSDEAAFNDAKHKSFEKELDSACSKFHSESDGYQIVDNPADYAVQFAKSANGLLKRLASDDPKELESVQSAVFTLASNSIADCWWTILKEMTPKEVSTTPTGTGYIGNKRSLKFHLPTCRYLPAEKNQVLFKSRDAAINEGYVPCKVCKP